MITQSQLRYAVVKAFDKANVCQEEYSNLFDDALQEARVAILERSDRSEAWQLSRATWAVFDWVIRFVYDSPPEYVDESYEYTVIDEYTRYISNEELDTFLESCLSGNYLIISKYLFRGYDARAIAIETGFNYDSVRVYISRIRKKLSELYD